MMERIVTNLSSGLKMELIFLAYFKKKKSSSRSDMLSIYCCELLAGKGCKDA
jgi:hypothetical protein